VLAPVGARPEFPSQAMADSFFVARDTGLDHPHRESILKLWPPRSLNRNTAGHGIPLPIAIVREIGEAKSHVRDKVWRELNRGRKKGGGVRLATATFADERKLCAFLPLQKTWGFGMGSRSLQQVRKTRFFHAFRQAKKMMRGKTTRMRKDVGAGGRFQPPPPGLIHLKSFPSKAIPGFRTWLVRIAHQC